MSRRGVPGRAPAARWASDVLRRGGPPAGPPRPTSSWSTPTSTGSHLADRRGAAARARRRRHRRGPPARGHHLGHGRAGARRRPVLRPGPRRPARCSPTTGPRPARARPGEPARPRRSSRRVGQRLRGRLPDAVVDALVLGRAAASTRRRPALRAIDTGARATANQRKVRAQKAATALHGATSTPCLDRAPGLRGLGRRHRPTPRLEVAPIDVGQVLLPRAVGRAHGGAHQRHHPPPPRPSGSACPRDRTDVLDVGSPFDYGEQALLYCAAHLPDPRNAAFAGADATTSWRRSSPPPAGARWRCSPAGAPCRPRPRPCGRR